MKFWRAGAALAFVVCGLWWTATCRAGDLGVEVVASAWTGEVREREPVGVLDAAQRRRPLALWTRLVGGQEALAQLKAEGKLPIVHRWSRLAPGLGQLPDRATVTDEVQVAPDFKALIGGYEVEVLRRGTFDWRLWSMKAAIDPGHWRVDVLYADGTPVRCRNTGQPCRFLIEAR